MGILGKYGSQVLPADKPTCGREMAFESSFRLLTYLTANPRRPWRPSRAARNYSGFFTALNAVLIARGASGNSRHRRLLTVRSAGTALNQPLSVPSLGSLVSWNESFVASVVRLCCVVLLGRPLRCLF